MRILLVSATDAEIAPFLGALRDASPHDIEVLTTGVGMVATAVWCGVVSFVLLKIIDATIGLRVSEEAERDGLDLALHGERMH